MLKRFYPMEYLDNIYAIDFERLRGLGIRGLLFDIDNTLAPFDIPEPDDRAVALFARLAESGYRVCLLSNNAEQRVAQFNKKLGLHAIHKAGKPKLKGVTSALALLGTKPSETALIGDQVFTDIWCGNRIGMHTILVKPIAQRDEFVVRLKRGFERIVIQTYLRYIRKAGQDGSERH